MLKYITNISSSEHNYNIILDYEGKVLLNNAKGENSLDINKFIKSEPCFTAVCI